MIIAITLIAIAAVAAISLSASGGDGLNFAARDERQAVRVRSVRS